MSRKAIGQGLIILALALALTACTQLLTDRSGIGEQSGVAPTAVAGSERVRVFIGFTHRPGAAEEALIRGAKGEIHYTYHLIPAIAATIPEAAIEALQRNPNVTVIEPDVEVYALDAELDEAWGVKHIGAGTVHDSENEGYGIKVAVLDTGIDYTHPDLDANYKGGWDFVNGDSDPMDDNGHGTHVAGTVAAEDDGSGVVGVAPGASLYALKVLDETGSGYFSAVVAALEWCVESGVQITNNSYGSSQDPGELVKEAFDNAYAAGVLNVASAGNSGNPPGRGDNISYPAHWDSVIAVAATDQDDSRARWSSTGPSLELSAPGVAINSTLPGGGYGEKSGTSMASPHVAGTAALVWAADSSLTNEQVRVRLQDTADDLGALGWDSKYGYGLVDADEAADVEAPPSTGDTMHVASIDMTLKSTGPWVRAIATVTIVDTADSLVDGATVSGSWTGAVAGTDSAVTDSAGQAVFQSDKVRSPSSGTTFTFCVEAVVKSGWTYDPEDDVETCSSIVVP